VRADLQASVRFGRLVKGTRLPFDCPMAANSAANPAQLLQRGLATLVFLLASIFAVGEGLVPKLELSRGAIRGSGGGGPS